MKRQVDSSLFLEQKYALLLENSFDAIFVETEIKRGVFRFIEINDTACNISGYSKDELLKLPKEKLFLEDNSPIEETIMLITKEGRTIRCKKRSSVVEQDGKKLLFIILKDMTEIEHLIKEKQTQDEVLLQQSKMASMGEMIANIAHQWKQPINIISLLIQQIDSVASKIDSEDAKKLQSIEKRVIEQLKYMSQTITDFKEFCSPAKEKSSFDAGSAISEIYRLLKPKFDKQNIEVRIAPSEKIVIYGYLNEFKHVIVNILNNAREKLETTDNDEKIVEVNIKKEGENAVLSFSDNGGGIDALLLPYKLFEPYVSTKGSEGTGIGLSICKTIVVSNMGGEISAKNGEKGAIFTVKIPIKRMEFWNR